MGLDDSVYQSIIASMEKLNALYRQSNTKASALESAKEIQNEASAMDKVEESATTAATKKEKFADANKKVEQSAENTTDAVQAEADAMMDMSNLDSILAGVNMQGQQGHSVFQRFGNTLREAFLAYTGANLLQDALHEVTRAGKEAIDTVKELNDLKTDLQMVTGDSSDKVGALINDYNDLAQELGATTKAVGESADAFLRQGRTMQETNQLIQDSMVLSKVAKIDSDKSAEILTATINGFKLAASEASHVNDALSAIDLASASDAGGIGEALTKVASMANNAGVSLERTAAIIATIKDVTQDSDESIGTSLKTILSRMNQIKAGKFIDAETGEALNDVEKVLNKVGISMRDANNQFEDSEVVLDRVAEKWQSFDKNTQKAVSTALAGTYQYNKLVAALDNWDKVQNLTNLAMNSDGSAESKFEVYLDSLEAKTQALQASLESLASDTIPDDLYASVLDTVKAMIDAADNSGILKSALAGLGTVGAIYTFQHLASYLGEAAQGFSDLGTAMTMTKNTIADASDMQRLLDLTQGLSQSQTRLILSTNTLTDAQKIAILMNQNMSEAEATATLQAWNLSAAQQGATASTMTLSGVLKGLYATMAANPLILVGLAVTAGVTLWQKYKQSLEEADKKAEESKQKFDELSSEIDDLNSELETTKKRIDELANKDVSLTLVEQDELDRLRAQNDELEREIELKKYAAQMEGKRAATEAVSAINKKTESYIEYYTAEDGNTYNAERHESRIEAMQRQIALAEQLKQEQDELIQKQKELEDSYRDESGVLNYEALTKDSAYDYYNNQMDTLSSRIEYAEGKMADYYNDLSSLDDALYDDYGNIISGAEETADKLNSVYEAYLQYGRGGKTVVQNLSDYFDSEDNQTIVQKLNDAYAQYANGDISDATLKSMTEYAEVMDATGISAEGLTTHLKDLYEAKKELSDSSTDIGITEPLSFTESISQVQALSAGFDQLDKIYADVLNKEDFDWSSILNNTSFSEAFSECTDAYNEFIKTVANSPDDINACQNAFNNLATAYIENKGVLNDLTEENKQATITMLEQMGIENADEVVTATLAHNKEELAMQNILLANSTMDLSTVTDDEIQRLLNEGVITEEVAKQLASYAVEKQYTNDKVITTVGDCNNLIALMKTAEGTTEAIAKLEKLKARLYNDDGSLKVISNEERANVERAINNIAAEFNAKVSETIKVPQMTYNGGSTTKKAIEDANKASKSVSDAADKAAEEAEKAAEELAQKTKELVDSYMEYMDKSLDAGKIDYHTYCYQVKNYLDDMYRQGKITAEDYFSFIQKMLEKQSSIYDKALSGVINYLDTVINTWNEQINIIEDANDKLNNTKDYYDSVLSAISALLDDEIQKWQDKIDLINEENNALNDQKDIYDSVISAVTTLLDKESDSIQDQIDLINEKNDAIQDQIDKYDSILSAVDDVYDNEIDQLNAQKDALQEQIDALNDKNDAVDLQYRKEKTLYALEQAQQQRNRKVYTEESGYIYDTDFEAVRDAKKDLSDIQNEELIDSLKKEQDAIDDSIDNLQKYKDMWDDIAGSYEKAANAQAAMDYFGSDYINKILSSNAYDIGNFQTKYNSQKKDLEDNNDYLDKLQEQLDKYNNIKDNWSNVSSNYEEEKNNALANDVLGKDWQDKVLNDTFDLNDFTKKYNDILSKIDSNNDQIDSINEKIDDYNKIKDQWSSITDELEKEQNKQNAMMMFGFDWEQKILSGRLEEVTKFKDKYLKVQSEINSNEELINSYQGRVDYFERLKSQWQDLTSEYEKQSNAQYTAQILGADWEEKVLNGRLDTMNAFKDEYLNIQKEITEAAYNMAEAQKKAAEEAVEEAKAAADAVGSSVPNTSTPSNNTSSGSSTNSSNSSTKTNTSSTDETPNTQTSTPKYKVVDENGKTLITYKGEDAKNKAEKYKSGLDDEAHDLSKVKVQKCDLGGVVKINPNDILTDLAKKHGEDGFIMARNGERVLTESQNEGFEKGVVLFERFSDMLKNSNFMPNIFTSDLTKAAQNITNNNQPTYTVTMGDIHLHEVQNADQLGDAIVKRLPGIMRQKLSARK